MHDRVSSHFPSEVRSAIQREANFQCEATYSQHLLDIMTKVFWNRYTAIKAKPDSCCRKMQELVY
jgi:hypothetical protein